MGEHNELEKFNSQSIENKETRNTEELYSRIREVLTHARSHAYKAVNFTMVQAYWQIGHIIVENEQNGDERAA